MKKFVSILTILLSTLNSQCQKLECEAISYSSKEIPFRLERSYSLPDENSHIYAVYDEDQSYFLKITKSKVNDTIILSENYYQILNFRNINNAITETESQITYSSDDPFLMYYQFKFDGKLLADTSFSDSLSNQSFNSQVELLKKNRLKNIISDKMLIIDSLIHLETVNFYFLNTFLFKRIIFNKNNQPYDTLICNRKENLISCIEQSIAPFHHYYDFQWNIDSTNINIESKNIDGKSLYFKNINIKNLQECTELSESSNSVFKISDKATLFNGLLRQMTQIEPLFDVFIYNEINKYYELNRETIDGEKYKYEYTLDDRKRTSVKRVFSRGNLFMKVVYSYYD